MAGRRHTFQSRELKPGGFVGFGGDQKWKIIGSRKFGNSFLPSITNVLLIYGSKHNLQMLTMAMI